MSHARRLVESAPIIDWESAPRPDIVADILSAPMTVRRCVSPSIAWPALTLVAHQESVGARPENDSLRRTASSPAASKLAATTQA